MAYLAWVRVDVAHVLLAFRALKNDLFHVDPDLLHPRTPDLGVDQVEKFLNVAKQLLGNALAGAVDGHFQIRAAVEHGGGEHAHGDCLPEASGCGNEDFPRKIVPSVCLEDLLMVAGKRAVWFALPEDSSTCSYKVVVEHALMKRALPSPPVDSLQRLPAPEHALEPCALGLSRSDQVVLQRRPAYAPLPFFLLALSHDSVVAVEVARQSCGE